LDDFGGFTLIVSAGCAGGLDPSLLPGDVVLATALNGDGAAGALPTDASRRADAVRVAAAAGLRAVEGPVVCSAAVLTTVAEKRAAAAVGAIAVEMEGGPVAAAAAAARVPFLSVRTILDGAEHAVIVPPALIDPARGAVRPLAAAAYLATHPGVIRELRALQRLQRAASESSNASSRTGSHALDPSPQRRSIDAFPTHIVTDMVKWQVKNWWRGSARYPRC